MASVSTAGSDQIIHDQNLLSGLLMLSFVHLDGGGTILQIVSGGNSLSGKLALLTDQYKGLMIIVCDRGSEDKSADSGPTTTS